jgi:Ca2+-binding RTX toxin-like protein
VVTRNGTNNGSVIAELSGIEEIKINTGGGINTVLAIGDFAPTSLAYNTITIDGSGGDDTVDITGLTSAHRVVLNTGGGNDSIVGPVRVQDVINITAAPVVNNGTVGNDVMFGTAGDDIMAGGDGNDVLIGGAGNDTMMGGLGDDVYEVTDGGDVVVENAGEGVDTVLAHIHYSLSDNVENLLYGGTGSFTGYGNDLGNLMVGGSGSDTLEGGGGNDILVGRAGDDAMAGGLGDDTYEVTDAGDVVIENAGEGIDTVWAHVNYSLASTDNVENLLYGGNGNFTGTGNDLGNLMVGGSGADTLTGLGGNDILVGGAGIDTMIGGLGDDTYEVTESGDVVVENASEGSDTVWAHVNYALSANIENLIYGGTGNFAGTGNSLNNLVMGGNGIDILDGGAGADTLIGGAGADTFVFSALSDMGVGAGNRDYIGDFIDGSDHIDFSAIDANTGSGGHDSFLFIGAADFSGTAGQLRYVLVGSDTLLQADVNGDSVADFEVVMTGNHTFANAGDLVL